MSSRSAQLNALADEMITSAKILAAAAIALRQQADEIDWNEGDGVMFDVSSERLSA